MVAEVVECVTGSGKCLRRRALACRWELHHYWAKVFPYISLHLSWHSFSSLCPRSLLYVWRLHCIYCKTFRYLLNIWGFL